LKFANLFPELSPDIIRIFKQYQYVFRIYSERVRREEGEGEGEEGEGGGAGGRRREASLFTPFGALSFCSLPKFP
jgi:hypothetical protein